MDVVAGTILLCLPLPGAQAVGASMLGAGLGGIAGGYVSEAMGGSFETGAIIGGIVGAVIGGSIYRLVQHLRPIDVAKMAQETGNGEVTPDLGKKLDYAFGKASGSTHNVERSMTNASQLGRIGIHDTPIGRQILAEHFTNAFYANQASIMSVGGRATINTLLAGPGGFSGVRSIWEGNKLITFIFFGG